MKQATCRSANYSPCESVKSFDESVDESLYEWSDFSFESSKEPSGRFSVVTNLKSVIRKSANHVDDFPLQSARTLRSTVQSGGISVISSDAVCSRVCSRVCVLNFGQVFTQVAEFYFYLIFITLKHLYEHTHTLKVPS